MYDEFLKFKTKNKSYNSKLDGNLRKLKKELDDLKYSGFSRISTLFSRTKLI